MHNIQGPLDNQDSCYAPPSLRLPAAPEARRSASNSRLSWGEQADNILSQYPASYPAILDIATDLSLNKLFGFFFANHVSKAACQKRIARRMMAYERIWD